MNGSIVEPLHITSYRDRALRRKITCVMPSRCANAISPRAGRHRVDHFPCPLNASHASRYPRLTKKKPTVATVKIRSHMAFSAPTYEIRSGRIMRDERRPEKLLSGQAVPDPRLAHDVARLRRVVFDLLAQLSNEHPEVLRLIDRVVPPESLQYRAVG